MQSLNQPVSATAIRPQPPSGAAAFRHPYLTLAATMLFAGLSFSGNAVADVGNTGAVFVMTNSAAGNQVIAFERFDDGTLRQADTYDTNGLGTGQIRLSSQSSVVLTPDGHFLLVANVASNEISVFAVNGARLRLVDLVDSHGQTPNSITVHGNLVYVLNNGGAGMGNIAGFVLGEDGSLSFMPGSVNSLSAPGSDPAQVAFTPDGNALIVTEKATNKIDSFSLVHGLPTGLSVHDSDGVTPFGLDFTHNGVFVVTNAVNGDIGKATASSYTLVGAQNQQLRTISGSLADGRSEVCWTILSKDERFAYVTNFGDGSISSYDVALDGHLTLHASVATATSSFGQKSIRDEGRTPDGRYLYAIDITAQRVFGWSIQSNGSLVHIGDVPGVPSTVAGIAVR
jgi:6-phosphogluconolactonase